MKPTIFYSWQSQEEKLNRYFIRNSLMDAANTLEVFEPRLDEATKGVAGWPDIVPTILDKICACDVFVADVTVMHPAVERLTPNANVMFELGYAFAKLHPASIILVMNAAFIPKGKDLTDMPFDLRGRRGGLEYCLRQGEDPKPVQQKLAKALASAINESMTQGPLGQIASFLAETNPEIIYLIRSGSRAFSVAVVQHRVPVLEKIRRPPFARFVKIGECPARC